MFIQGAKRRRAIRGFRHRMTRFRERLGERISASSSTTRTRRFGGFFMESA
jgi:hypothetical protein